MKIIIAPDSFKECLDALAAARAIAKGVEAVLPRAEVVLLPVADGGEGTVQALVTARAGEYVHTVVRGPLGHPVSARWGLLPDGTGVIEMAAASGLPLVPAHRRNPLLASTYGTGQLILAALDRGCRRLILGLGGSATVDGGAGALAALGAVLLDKRGERVPPTPRGLLALHSLDLGGLDRRLAETAIIGAADVDNLLLGPRGAARVFGPQKGADRETVPILEEALRRLSAVALASLAKDITCFPGSGAAGGLAAGLSLAAQVTVQPGIELVLAAMDFSAHLKGTDLVLTGEGRIDAQSAMGKALAGIARLTKGAGVPLIAFCGSLGEGYRQVYALGVTAVQPIAPGPVPLEEALARTPAYLSGAAEGTLRVYLAGSGCQRAGKDI